MKRGKAWRGYPALSKPLTIMGVERRWFLLSATLGLAMWNAINSIGHCQVNWLPRVQATPSSIQT